MCGGVVAVDRACGELPRLTIWNRYRMPNQRARKGRFPSLEGEVSGSRVRGLGRTDLGYGSEGSAPQAQPSPSVQERAVGAESFTSGNHIEDLDSDLEGPDAEVFRVWGSSFYIFVFLSRLENRHRIDTLVTLETRNPKLRALSSKTLPTASLIPNRNPTKPYKT